MASAATSHKGPFYVTQTNATRIYSGQLPVVSVVATVRPTMVTAGHQVEVMVNGAAITDGLFPISHHSLTFALSAPNGAIKTIDIYLRGTGPGQAQGDYDLSIYL